jgi:hypothetical protein
MIAFFGDCLATYQKKTGASLMAAPFFSFTDFSFIFVLAPACQIL